LFGKASEGIILCKPLVATLIPTIHDWNWSSSGNYFLVTLIPLDRGTHKDDIQKVSDIHSYICAKVKGWKLPIGH